MILRACKTSISFAARPICVKALTVSQRLFKILLNLDPYSDSIFLFSGWSKDRYKCLYFDGDGFAMLYKRLDNGKLQWPKDENEVRNLSQQELRWLLEGLSLQQPKAIAKSAKGVF